MLTRRDMIRVLACSGLACGLNPAALIAQAPKEKRLGICSISFALRWAGVDRGQGSPEDLLQLVEHCHELGAGGVQTSIPLQEGLSAKLRAKVESYGMFLEGQLPLPRSRADVDLFETRVRAAKEAGASVLRTACLGGRRYETFKDAAEFAAFAKHAEESIGLAEPIVRKHQVRLSVENHKDWRVPELVALLRRISSEYVGVCLDTGNSIALLEDPMAVVEAYAPYAFATHLKDMAVKEYESGFLLAEVPMGEGFLDLPAMVGILRRARPELQFSLEMITRNPLQVPCLARPYWATFEALPGTFLAETLSMVRAHPPRKPMPDLSGLTREQKIEAEEQAVRRCVAYARESLQL
jgi:sugar phosphate isomerase/epimerase